MTAFSGDSKKKKNGNSSGGFQNLGLSDEVYRGIVKLGFRIPTPVQRKALPVILSGMDTVVMARTGSGKTAAFLIPMLEKLLSNHNSDNAPSGSGSIKGLILSPTRELSTQTLRVLKTLSFAAKSLKCVGVTGGESMEMQFEALASNPDIVVATPGRLAHHLSEIPDLTLNGVQMIVLDEADRLFEMGFAQQIRIIASKLPTNKQTLLFSATMPKALVEFTKTGGLLSSSEDPAIVRLDNESTVSSELRMAFLTTRTADKDAALLHLLRHMIPTPEPLPQSSDDKKEQKKLRAGEAVKGLILIFAATRHHVDYLTMLINKALMGDTQTNTNTPLATCIYGTMDQEARHQNLTSFRRGISPILVVTDVAARGIDVPLIDHVIHYQFPPSPKLFVHRSGRAARAGRIGYGWSLVDTEELPYMIDLFLFLGRPLQTTSEEYSMEEMTPDMVHYGTVPDSLLHPEIEYVKRIVDSELSGGHDVDTMKGLVRVCANAMKQYRRSRPEPSTASLRKARALLEGEKDISGKRILETTMKAHPLLLHKERQVFVENKTDLELVRKRQDFLQQMQNFRPKETVFEAFQNSKKKESTILGQVDKGRTSNKIVKANHSVSSAGLVAMKDMRRQMKLAREKGTTLVIAGSKNAQVLNGDIVDTETTTIKSQNNKAETTKSKTSSPVIIEKRRLSKAERKRMKKNPSATITATDNNKEEKKKTKKNYRDEEFYMDYTTKNNSNGKMNKEDLERSRRVEAALQPSFETSSNKSSLLKLEESMLDVIGDERADLVQRHRIMRWDKSKRKYIQTTLGAELSGESLTKRTKLESGQIVRSNQLKLGELYQKWQKKSNRSIGRTGVFDDVTSTTMDTDINASSTSKVKSTDVIKTKQQIQKQRLAEKDKKLKNMKKDVRKRMEDKQRQERNAQRAAQKPGWQGKKGYSGRHGAIIKGKKKHK